MTAKRVPLGLELAAKLAIVVDLAVEDELDSAVERFHRLVPERREIDDRKARMPEPDARLCVLEDAGVVGSTVREAPHPAFKRGWGEPS
jgi:hypothetical protein